VHSNDAGFLIADLLVLSWYARAIVGRRMTVGAFLPGMGSIACTGKEVPAVVQGLCARGPRIRSA
jgi:hypothetical protein